MELIIKVNRGIVTGVYTHFPENIIIRVTDDDDRYDEERQHEYHAIQKLIDSGAVVDALYGSMETSEASELTLPAPDPNTFLLIRDLEAVKTETGKKVQLLYAAYIDGYLRSHAEICKFARKFAKENSDTDIDFLGFYNVVKPLLEKQLKTYDGLCDELNKSEEFDQTAEE